MVGMTRNEYLKRYVELQKKSWSGVRTSKSKKKQNTVECGIIDTMTKRRY